eukprot:TRINITY_DN4111_c0_g2_i1.p1 TRINITY_DN4111_c0_g2~~TRINITY_DN4111_c0_g2_i1.p1  ORF type:complete len:141 (+),score=26.95 TRINITY_DN4111_c0_g2_i1:60-482(+)
MAVSFKDVFASCEFIPQLTSSCNWDTWFAEFSSVFPLGANSPTIVKVALSKCIDKELLIRIGGMEVINSSSLDDVVDSLKEILEEDESTRNNLQKNFCLNLINFPQTMKQIPSDPYEFSAPKWYDFMMNEEQKTKKKIMG